MADRPRGNYRGRGGRNDRQRRPQDGAQGRDREWGGDRQRRPQDGAQINVAGIRYWTRDEIADIAKLSPAAIVQKIQDEEAAFLNAYGYDRNHKSMFVMHKLIKILNTLCNSSEVDFISRRLSQIISDCAGFMMKLKEIVMTTDDKSCLQSLVNICRFCTEKIPQTAIFKLPHSELKDAIEQLEDPPLNRIFEDYCKQYDMKKEEMKKMRKEEKQQSSSTNRRYGTSKDELQNLHSQRPPNNFREIEVLPQASEFGKAAGKPFLRPVIIKGSYQNWDHYLDVQFRLLREDFMSPLRDGIHEFLTGNERNKSVHLYFGAKILEPICLYTGIGFNVKFDINASRLNRVRWEHSRRLIFGSLLCMSSNNFKTILFASVVKRDPDQLKNGYLTVKFEGDVNGFAIDPATQFTMVESTAYFEAYRHVLEGLQQVTVDQMPFTQHIIGGFDYSNPIPLPLCIRGNPKYDLNRILELRRPIGPIDVSSRWPHIRDNVCLDESQLKAFKMALSQQVSVLQGPPGTGKTYIAKKIVKAMLQNRSVWDPMGNSPILVVCYTNHALDQFLEGIIARGNGITDVLEGSQKPRIVRVGGRCKSEELKECAMANLVSLMKRNREVPGRVYREVKENRITMKALANKMDQSRIAIDAMEGKLLTVDELDGVMNDRHHQQLKFGLQDVPEHKHIEAWLGLWLVPENDGEVEEELDEEEQLAVALAANEEGDGNQQAENQGGVVIEGENGEKADFIDVIDEPQVLQDERMIEGDVIELGHNAGARGQAGATVREKVTKKGGWEIKQLSQKDRKDRIKRGMRHSAMTDRDARNVLDIWRMEKKDRWRLYQYWLNQYIRQAKEKLQISGDYYNRCAQQCIDTDHELNKLTLGNADIVGMTTTGAAKHSYIFKNFHPKILIVEEAAEVLESHVITSLCASVEQMVLIGDHKQLQPKITCFDLEKYDLHVSLFERLAMKGFPIATLSVQHRMRPEIASIVGNHVYDKLENHESVLRYDHVKGVGKDLFFIEHAQPEKGNPTGDQRSHANPFEADYVASLTRHLLKQGYEPSQITILTMYRGQLFEIKQKMTREEFGGVRVTAVDDFQGEENDIVIISLVRSNNEGSIGFLKVENRICVSLSRAKKGMYVIGNFAMLRDKKETKWPKIIDQMEREGYLGEGLPLCCQIHTQEKIIAKIPQDFSKSPEGGCRKQCGTRLDCGHMCWSPCHPLDPEHQTLYRCQQNCGKTLPNCRHKCARRCYDCLDGCPPCEINVSKKLPYCGHDVRMSCCDDPSKFQCNKACDKRISNCGHQCQSKCSQPCTPHNLCQAPVRHKLSCNHIAIVPCSADQSSIVCQEPCNKKIDSCQHDCKGTCGKCSQGRLHVQCKKKCGRPQNCGHVCDFPCPEYCPPCSKPCGNYCFHSKCPKKCYEPCVPCREPCKWECRHHKCTKKCGEKCNRPPCDRHCYKTLKCGHPCIGLCGEDCPSLCRICDKAEVTEVFFGTEDEDDAKFIQLKDCKHIFEVSGLDHWMESQSEAKDGEDQSVMVKFVECPKCKTPIRRSLRYGNIIKTTIANMEEIKILNMKNGVKTSLDELFLLANSNTAAISYPPVKKVFREIINRISSAKASAKPGVPPLLPLQMSTIENQIELLPKLAKLFDCLNKLDTRKCQFSPRVVVYTTQLVSEAMTLLEFLKANDLNPQQAQDAECELRRLFCLSRACQMKYNAMKEGETFNPDDEQSLEREVEFYRISGTTTPKATPEDQARTDALLVAIMRKYSIGGQLSASEKLEIVKAMSDIQRGGWYKCPKGHIYAIGECGGATEVGKCPECGSRVGGTGHQLTAGNVHAGEMDGSRHAAWSEAANMANFDPNQLDALFH